MKLSCIKILLIILKIPFTTSNLVIRYQGIAHSFNDDSLPFYTLNVTEFRQLSSTSYYQPWRGQMTYFFNNYDNKLQHDSGIKCSFIPRQQREDNLTYGNW